ncbi:hypothetical protein RHMOL_Rhmol06G0024100 [Rhododendron molle]|uniref:Uncharacterized protein n=1 Tax=Rhododendron molle TaxID=49168 RepID=A0ACC0N8M5_RHOML|nr:hypothetical protein RHMOL_Rhmol06G0024100 [Rhododendron molle]
MISAPYTSMREQDMEEHIVIMGGGIAGLTTALGLHRFQVGSSVSSVTSENESPDAYEGYESRCVRRKELLETLERELPHGTIRYSSKVVSIEGGGYHKFLHLTDGSTLKAKVTIASFSKRKNAMRTILLLYSRFGLERNASRVDWLFILGDKPLGALSGTQMAKAFSQGLIFILAEEFAMVVFHVMTSACTGFALTVHLSDVSPCTKNISKGNVCVAGDALHRMTPDIGQGGCSALEEGVDLAWCLAEALLKKPRNEIQNEEEEYGRIKKGLEKFAKERRWRSFSLISAAYVVGFIQERDGKVMRFLREKFLSRFTISSVGKMADFHCGELNISGSN